MEHREASQTPYAAVYKKLYGFEDEIQDSGPYGWIQYKGSNICVDIHCSCGELSHYDGDFAYAVRCPYCQKAWVLGQTVRLVELPVEIEMQDYFHVKLADE